MVGIILFLILIALSPILALIAGVLYVVFLLIAVSR
jgi:hypothetical protein